MIDYDENQTENEKQFKQTQHDIPKPRPIHKYTEDKMCENTMMVMYINPHLSNS